MKVKNDNKEVYEYLTKAVELATNQQLRQWYNNILTANKARAIKKE